MVEQYMSKGEVRITISPTHQKWEEALLFGFTNLFQIKRIVTGDGTPIQLRMGMLRTLAGRLSVTQDLGI